MLTISFRIILAFRKFFLPTCLLLVPPKILISLCLVVLLPAATAELLPFIDVRQRREPRCSQHSYVFCSFSSSRSKHSPLPLTPYRRAGWPTVAPSIAEPVESASPIRPSAPCRHSTTRKPLLFAAIASGDIPAPCARSTRTNPLRMPTTSMTAVANGETMTSSPRTSFCPPMDAPSTAKTRGNAFRSLGVSPTPVFASNLFGDRYVRSTDSR